MENDHTKNGENKTAKELRPSSADIQADEKPNKSKSRSNKAKKQKKWSLWRHWKAANRKQQLKWVAEFMGGLIAASILVIYIVDHFQRERQFQREHAPLIVHNRPPQFLQTYKCIPVEHAYQSTGRFAHGDFQIGNIDKTYKNIGKATAIDVSGIAFNRAAVVPVKRTDGSGAISDQSLTVTPKDCDTTLRLPGSPLEPEMEDTIHIREEVASVSPNVKDGDYVTFEYEICTTYAEQGGTRHGTCDLYRLFTKDVPNLPPVDQIMGTPELPCDGIARTANFVPVVGAHCQD